MTKILNEQEVIMTKLLKGIFNDPDKKFSVESKIVEDFTYDEDYNDMFIKYASDLVEFNVYDDTSCILVMYFLIESGKQLYYISFASFDIFPGCKYGTKVVEAVMMSTITTIRISDRSEVVNGNSIWGIITDKFPMLTYQEV